MRLPLLWVFTGLLVSALLSITDAASPTSPATLSVDCSNTLGPIRPLHGANDGPIQCGELIDLSAFYRELAIPLTRLHDCHWPTPDVVDMHVVFPDPKADPDLPASYSFVRTDDYLAAVLQTGSQIVYRLGESIEHSKRKYHVHPPADYDRWAAACLGIIRHYNEGWTNGFRHNIRYWEIWNEPENRPTMWSGTDEGYFRLYEVTAKAIKGRYPDLKVGGPSLGYTGKIVAGRFEPSDFLIHFLEFCQKRALPLDFFSWHLYTDNPAECVLRAQGIRQTLNRFGFARTESHLNEWNYLPDNSWTPMMLQGQGLPREQFYDRIGNAEGAAFSAAVLMNLQDAPIDIANYYAANTQGFGLFSPHGAPRKVFHAFKAFRLLLDTPLRLPTRGGNPSQLVICAGTNSGQSEIGILISQLKPSDEPLELTLNHLPWNAPTLCQMSIVDQARNLDQSSPSRLDPARPKIVLNLKAPFVCFVKLKPAADK